MKHCLNLLVHLAENIRSGHVKEVIVHMPAFIFLRAYPSSTVSDCFPFLIENITRIFLVISFQSDLPRRGAFY